MRRITTFFLFLIFFSNQLTAQVPVSQGNAISIDFNTYSANGFTPSPGSGQLDSDQWRVTGLSDGDGTFGGTHDAADFARGTNGGGVSTGGVYSFEVSAGDYSLGVQPTGTDWNTGTFDLRLINNTGNTLTELNIQYNIFVLNNGDRSNSFNFSYSDDDISYNPIGSLDFASTETADGTPSWDSNFRIASINGLSVVNGGFLYLRWQGTDISGSGSRDEFALDNILITEGDTPLPVELNSFNAVGKEGKVIVRWRTASEVNNQGFIVLRANAMDDKYLEISSYMYNEDLIGAGTSSVQHNYSYIDQSVFNGSTYWYKLIDVDLNGTMEEHGPVSATPYLIGGQWDNDVFPETFALYQNFPNPFNPSTKIIYDIPQMINREIYINLSVYNILGQKITELFNGRVESGTHSVKWNGLDEQGNAVPAGIYIYQIISELFTQSKKMIYLK